MSKRESADLIKDGHSIFVKDLRDLGYTPEGVLNWIALMGWSFDGTTEYFTLPDLVDKFSIDHLNPSPAAINFTKLDYFNGLHIRNLTDAELAKRVKPYLVDAGYAPSDEILIKIAPILKERLQTLDEVVEKAAIFFVNDISYDASELVPSGMTKEQSLGILKSAQQIFSSLKEMKKDLAEPPMREVVEKSGFSAGQVFGILRIATTGLKVSPPLFESMEIFGLSLVMKRINEAITKLS